ncbi:MAG: 3-hydroxyisobutyrate dehydrogenase [Pseudomonadota bacterium]
MTTIAFIGLGNMGGPMAANLVAAGHAVIGVDLSDVAKEALKSAGGSVAATAHDAAGQADVVVTMLPAGPHVEAVYADVMTVAKPGSVFIDSSTIDVPTARKVIAKAEEAGFHMVDAPVSGGTAAAQAGTLTFMTGGTAQAFEKAKPYLDIMGKNVFHAGDAGNGQVAKVANNMLLAISMIGTAEAFKLAEKLGLDAQTFFDISSTASGQCWSMTSYCPAPGPVPAAPANNDYKPGFAAAMMLKDLRLALDAAKTAGAAIPLGAQSSALYTLMESAGKDDLDFSAIIKLISGDL